MYMYIHTQIIHRASILVWLSLATPQTIPRLLVDPVSSDIMVRIVMVMMVLAFAQLHAEAPELGFKV